MSLGVAGARHLQALLGSLGRLARSPLSTVLTLLVIALALALPTSLRNTPRSRGLETKSKAPSFKARTADSILPWAVMTATGTAARFSWIQATRSSPSPSGRRMSVRHRSKRSALRSRRAPLRSDAVRVVSFMRLKVRLTSSSRSGSSSTTSTTG